MANWEESICLRCGQAMTTEPCLVGTEPSWLDDYPGVVRWNVQKLEKNSQMPLKYHISRCEGCGAEVLVAVHDPYFETENGRVAVKYLGEYHIISDETIGDKGK